MPTFADGRLGRSGREGGNNVAKDGNEGYGTFRRDPQVASGPIALAAADMVTLLLYFNLGRWLLR